MLQTVLDQLVEADGVHEERPVDSIDGLGRDACVEQDQTVDAVARDRVLMFRLEDDTWDVKVLSVLQRLVDPRFEHLGAHLDLPVFRLEAGALGLDLCLVNSLACRSRRVRLVSDGRSACLEWFVALATATASRATELERCESACNCASILAVHVLAQLLMDDGDVQEAFEG